MLSFLTVVINENGGKVTPVVVDTGGKLTAGVVDTNGYVDLGKDVTAGVDDTGDQFAAGVVDIKSKISLFCPFKMIFLCIRRLLPLFPHAIYTLLYFPFLVPSRWGVAPPPPSP